MTDINDIMTSYQNRQKALSEANAFNKDAVFDTLAAGHITRVDVTFDGEGDSGQIEEICAYAGDTLWPPARHPD